MGERKWALSLVEGVFPIKTRPVWRFFLTLCLIRGWVSWIFLVWDLQVVVTRVGVLLNLMFSRRY